MNIDPDKLKIHPTAARFPALPDDEFAALVEHLKKHGLQQEIVLTYDRNTLVDGINRLRACKEAGAKPKFRFLPKGASETDVIDYIEGANFRRRDLIPGQKAALALEVAGDREAAEAKERQLAGKGVDGSGGRGRKKTLASREAKVKGSGRTARKIAARAKVGHASVSRAKAVKQYSPALYEDVLSGKITLNDAYKQVRKAKATEPEQTDQPKPTKTHVILVTHTGQRVPYPLPKSKPTFNRTNEDVSWAHWTWNPVTGCLHNCGATRWGGKSYCYANALSNKPSYKAAYPVGFTPLFHHERLDAPANHVIPEEAKTDPRFGRVFVCSMADLYGKWVPHEWIEQVHAKMVANPQWEYLMLTKFPRRYVGLEMPPMAWLGTSVDEQKRVRLAEEAFREISGVRVKWLSLEPLLEPLQFTDLSMFDWIVIGAQSRSEQPEGVVDEFRPDFEWVARLTDQALEAGCRVYHKPNLLSVGMNLIQQGPRLPPLVTAQGELALDPPAQAAE